MGAVRMKAVSNMLQLTYLGNNLFVYLQMLSFSHLVDYCDVFLSAVCPNLENNKLIYILDVNVQHILISERPN